MNWLAVTGFFLLLFVLSHSEAKGQASSSVAFTIVVHEDNSSKEASGREFKNSSNAFNTVADQHSRHKTSDAPSSEVSMYMDVGEVIKPIGPGTLTGTDTLTGTGTLNGTGNSIEEIQPCLRQVNDLASFPYETSGEGATSSGNSVDESGDYRVILEYN